MTDEPVDARSGHPFGVLDPERIAATLWRLHRRIVTRFPDAGLGSLCRQLAEVADKTQEQAQLIGRPNLLLRGAIGLVLAAGLLGFAAVIRAVMNLRFGTDDALSFFQGTEAAMNIVVLGGAALLFLFSVESRIKRRRALAELHELRSAAHVIDMHQLTKDPSAALRRAETTAASPKRTMNARELVHYLDYCSEMLSLIGKLAAVYAQYVPDSVVVDAVNNVETLTAGLSRKIWQKIAILESAQTSSSAAPQLRA